MADDYASERRAVEAFCAVEGWLLPDGVLARQMATAREEQDDALGRLRHFQTGWGAFSVSSRGHVVRWLAPETHALADDTGPDAAQALATAFLERHVPDLQRSYKLVSQTRVGTRYKHLYEQVPPADAVSIYYNFLLVAVQAGSVRAYQHEDLVLIRRTPLAFDEPAARARVLELSGGAGLDRAFVSEQPRAGGTAATTVWEIEVFYEGEGMAGLAKRNFYLDADTGQPCQSNGLPRPLEG